MTGRDDLDGKVLVESVVKTSTDCVLYWKIDEDWVAQQTMARLRRELEADEAEFQDRLAQARRKEQAWRRARAGRIIKRPVRISRDLA